MKLPLQTDPYTGIDRETRIPVRSNIVPKAYDHIFKQLCPLHGIQAQIIAHVLNKLHSTILTDPLLEPYRIYKPNGSIAFFYDEGVLRDLATIVERCSFDSTDPINLRPADSGSAGNDGRQGVSGEHDSGPVKGIRDSREDAENVGPDAESQIDLNSEGFKNLAKALFKTD